MQNLIIYITYILITLSANGFEKKFNFDSNTKFDAIKEIEEEYKGSDTDNKYYNAKKIATLSLLDKTFAKSKVFDLEIETSTYFGNIEIILKKCLQNINIYDPDANIALISIIEEKPNEDENIVFNGWIFSSSLFSAPQHPKYEIFLKACHGDINDVSKNNREITEDNINTQ